MEQADRFNGGKCRLGMIPLDCHKWEADGFTWGAKKYSQNNWRKGLPITATFVFWDTILPIRFLAEKMRSLSL